MKTKRMNFFKSFPLALLLCGFACAANPGIKKITGGLVRIQEVDQIVTGLMDSAQVTGLGLAVLNENKPIYVKAYGFKNKAQQELLDENTVMAGASFSKAVFAYMVMQLVQENALNLDKPLYQYLDKPLPEATDYHDLASDERWRRLTARICLSHTTGFPNSRFLNPRGNGKLEFFFEPGSRYAYSGEGIQLLQFVVEHITHKGLEELARDRVFGPLGMNRSSFIWQDQFAGNYAHGHDIVEAPIAYRKMASASGSGSLLTTISDYAKFVAAVMQRRNLAESAWQAMLSPAIKINSLRQFPALMNETTDKYQPIGLSYGLGWGMFTCPFGRAFFKEGHGNGWQNYNVNFVDQKTSVIIMTNSDNGEKIFKDLLAKVIGDSHTPWEWQGYTPYDLVEPKPIGVYLYDILLLENVDKAIEKYFQIKKSKSRKSFVFDEGQLDDLGQEMMKEKKIEYAIALFKANRDEYPNSAQVYYRLGEAYRFNGQFDLAIENYKKSLAINPKNGDARKKLEELE